MGDPLIRDAPGDFVPPAGVAYHYAPLAFVPADRNAAIVSLRQMFDPIAH